MDYGLQPKLQLKMIINLRIHYKDISSDRADLFCNFIASLGPDIADITRDRAFSFLAFASFSTRGSVKCIG